MRLKKYLPLILAVVVFIISNIVDRTLNSKKEYLTGRIATIEKNHDAYLRYSSLATSNFNFAQLHLNSVVESTVNQQPDARKFYMAHVADQISRAIKTFDEAANNMVNNLSTDDKDLISNLSNASNDGSFEGFYQSCMLAFKRTQELQSAVSEKMQQLGSEKANAQLSVARIDSKQSVLLNITIAINFLILLFEFIEKYDRKEQLSEV